MEKWDIAFTIVRVVAVLVLVGGMIAVTACEIASINGDKDNMNENHLYYKNIEVEVTSIEKNRIGWMIVPKVKITVYSKEYDLEFSDVFIGYSDLRECEEGDIIIAELYTWKNDRTGEINRRTIHKIYRDQTGLVAD